MTHADATQLATRIAHDLATLTPRATRYAFVDRTAPGQYHVTVRMGTATHAFASADAWVAHVAAWEQAQRSGPARVPLVAPWEQAPQDETAKDARPKEHWSLTLLIYLAIYVGLPVGFGWCYAHSPLLRWICFVLFSDDGGPFR